MAASKDLEAFYKIANYPLVNFSDMLPEVREEAVDICVTAVEKYQKDPEKATQVRDGGSRYSVLHLENMM